MEEGKSVPELYGSLVFSDAVMRERLPKDIYKAVHKTIENGTHLELDVANTVAAVMKEWAVEHGATHFTHWFQPMTGLTAEKLFPSLALDKKSIGKDIRVVCLEDIGRARTVPVPAAKLKAFMEQSS